MIARNLILIKRKAQSSWHRIYPKMSLYTPRFLVVALLFCMVFQQQINFHISFGLPGSNTDFDAANFKTNGFKNEQNASLMWWETAREADLSGLNLANEATAVSSALTAEQQAVAAKFSNLGFILNPDAAKKHGVDAEVVQFKQQKVAQYIQKYLNTSREEAKLYNVPIAITLAQALLESNAGDSQLARKENNHFGIKCNSKCVGCECANYTDDSPKDMFRVFESPWYSFREHSKLLQNKRYKHLLSLPRTDYRNWAYGLQAAGYATDKKYAEKLIKIIEVLKLHKYDQAEG